MKKKIILSVFSLCVLLLFVCAFTPASADKTDCSGAVCVPKTTETRFLNMLNRNFVYDGDFEDVDIIAENSVLALLHRRDTENSDYISEPVVKGFIKDMYGIDIIDISDDEQMHRDGFVYIVPRGFTSYSHVIESVVPNEDGSFTVYSSVIVSPHDDAPFTARAETLFVLSDDSAFGYNIIFSNLDSLQKTLANGEKV